MQFYESRQSETSPLKYVLELSPEEAEKVKQKLFEIMEQLKKKENE